MAQAVTYRFGKAFILLGDGASPEVFTAPCGFESLTMTLNIESNNVNIPDCDDPDLAAWLATDIVSQQMVLSGSGVVDKAALVTWQTWWFDDGNVEKNVRFFRDIGAATGGGHFQAPAIITAWEETGQRGNRWQFSTTVTMNGKPTFVSA